MILLIRTIMALTWIMTKTEFRWLNHIHLIRYQHE